MDDADAGAQPDKILNARFFSDGNKPLRSRPVILPLEVAEELYLGKPGSGQAIFQFLSGIDGEVEAKGFRGPVADENPLGPDAAPVIEDFLEANKSSAAV